jgi:long-chain fatty acid transport protein
MRRVALAVVLLLAPLAARAQGLSAPSIGTGASGPAEVDAAGVYWNPGLLGFVSAPTILVGGQLIVGDVRYQRNRRAIYQNEDSFKLATPVDPGSLDLTKTGWAPEVTANPVALAPDFFAAVPLGATGVTAGFGVYSPYAGILSFDPNGAQKWQLRHANIIVINVNPTLTYQVNKQLAFGAGMAYVVGYADLAKVQDFAALDSVGAAFAGKPLGLQNDFGASAPPAVRELSVTARPIELRNAIANGWSFSAGAAWRPTRDVLLGLAYQHSVALNFNGTFRLGMDDDFFTQDLASQGLKFVPVVSGDATLSFTLPRSILGGAHVQVSDRVGLGASAVYTTYSQTDAFRVATRSPDLAQPKVGLSDTSLVVLPRRWKDTIAVEGSVAFAATDRLALWGVAGFHSAASPDQTVDVASVDGDRLVGDVGLRFAVSPTMTLIGEAKVQHILERTVEASDYDLGNGRYNLTLLLLGGHLQMAMP